MASKIIFMIMALATALAFASASSDVAKNELAPVSPTVQSSSSSKLLTQDNNIINLRAKGRCNINPKVCRAAGSPGPDCCGKDCVDLAHNVLNCGQCGRKCVYGEVCCKGKCVNVQFDPKNCGWCGNKCNKEGHCKYGMCDYA